jgi:hypothetical protein
MKLKAMSVYNDFREKNNHHISHLIPQTGKLRYLHSKTQLGTIGYYMELKAMDDRAKNLTLQSKNQLGGIGDYRKMMAKMETAQMSANYNLRKSPSDLQYNLNIILKK